MKKSSKSAAKAPDRPAVKKSGKHKPGKQVRVPLVLAEAITANAARRLTSFPAEVVRYVREGAEREGIWPPAADRSS